MKGTIKFYLDKGQILKDKDAFKLSNKYMDKAKNNLTTRQLLFNVQENEKVRGLLKVSEKYDSNEWVVICGYYSMYAAALSLISHEGFRSKNHSATIALLEERFVKKKQLDKKDLRIIQHALFQKEELEKLSDARHKREIAQYSVTKETTKGIAEKIITDAYEFVNKVESIINQV